MAVVLALVAPASATTAATAAASPSARPIHRVVLRTLVAGLNVRRTPDIRATVTSHLGKRGTKVTADCWASGSVVAGNPVWYHIASPRKGYVTSYYIDTHRDPYPGLVRCKTPPFRRGYRTLVAGLRIRSGTSSRFRVVSVLGRAGSKVVVDCWTLGENISGDRVWYHLVSPRRGFVAGFHLDTGRDPALGVPHC
jgi:hypothetical protein